jgi:hypothetical protein
MALEQFTVYVPPKVHARLKSLAHGDGRTLSSFVVRALHRLVMPDMEPPLPRPKPRSVVPRKRAPKRK